jgi:hypothetical protein
VRALCQTQRTHAITTTHEEQSRYARVRIALNALVPNSAKLWRIGKVGIFGQV